MPQLTTIEMRQAATRSCARGGRLLLLAGTLLLGAACGNVGAPAAELETAAATVPAGVASATKGAATAVAGPLALDYARFPQSKTPEGYFVLGRPDAPLVMQHYSDFL